MHKSQKWYEDQYWNWLDVVAVDESFSDKWNRMSAEYIPSANIKRNIKYGDGPKEEIDLFIPDTNVPAPVLIFIHGGYWTWMDKDTYAFSLEPIRAAGALVASINYEPCPGNTITGIVDQVRRACIYIYENISAYDGDRENIHITGHSAGGQLTAMMATTDWQMFNPNVPIDALKSAIPSSGIFDMNNIRLTPQLNENIQMDKNEADKNSPLFLEPAYDMPISVVVGADESEGFLLESRDFAKAWSNKVTNLRYFEVPNAHHFPLIENQLLPGDPFTDLLLEHLGLDSSRLKDH